MTPEDWIGRPIADMTGAPYGTLEELFVGRTTGEPEFGIVSVPRLGQPGTKRVAVPLAAARPEGDVVVLPLDRARVREAPEVERTVESIPPEAGELIANFFAGAEQRQETARMDAVTAPTTPVPAVPAVPAPAPAPPVAEDEAAEVTLSEEELVVDKEAYVAERVRLRKVIVEEEVTVTVTLRREELVVEREPVTVAPPAVVDQVERGNGDAQLVEGELEFVLLAEEPVVQKRVVPVERVRVARDTVVEQRRIIDTVRKERAEVDETPAILPPAG
jgi:uncharacterized protein (TIGR02271 family)